jgi:hypothetical protein
MSESGDQRMGKCPRCGNLHGEPEKVLCARCREELASGAGSAGRSVKVQVGPILREALASVRAGEDIDEALLRALKARYHGEAVSLLAAITRLIDIEAGHHDEPRETVVRRLSEGVPGPELSISSSDKRTDSGFPGSFSRTVSQTQIIRVGDKEYRSLEELPPQIRRAVEEARSKGQSGRTVISSRSGGPRVTVGAGQGGVKTGCSWTLIAVVLRLIGR